jgi:hypothetical protein
MGEVVTNLLSSIVNQARAMRVAEIISDFRNLQYYLAAIETPSGSAGNSLDGYAILRACVADGRTVLNSAYAHASPPPRGDVDAEKAQLIMYVRHAMRNHPPDSRGEDPQSEA